MKIRLLRKKPSVKIIEKEDKKSIKPVVKESVETKKPVKKKDIKVTKEHLIQYMENHGTKSKRIQEILLKRCTDLVGDSDNKKIFQELFKYYKKEKE